MRHLANNTILYKFFSHPHTITDLSLEDTPSASLVTGRRIALRRVDPWRDRP